MPFLGDNGERNAGFCIELTTTIYYITGYVDLFRS